MAYNGNAWAEGHVQPWLDAGAEMNRVVLDRVRHSAGPDGRWRDMASEMLARWRAASRFEHLVATVGKEVFASARWPGEQVLAEDGAFRLTYIPACAGVEPATTAIFHVGGVIPYGDGIFRLTRESNLYERFAERGIPVYAMELKGDRYTCDYSDLTLDSLAETTSRLTDVAFEHGGGRRMVMEGYCGHGTQALVFLTSRPEEVRRKLWAFATFVSPMDGRRCKRIADAVHAAPDGLLDLNHAVWDRLGGYVPGDAMRVGLDLSLGAVYHKSPLGYFTAGWLRNGFANVRSASDLDARGRRELAGAYWISPESARRFPVPTGIGRFTTRMFQEGIADDGTLPWTRDGQTLSLRTLVEDTDLKVFGFYGGRDEVVPDATAHCLLDILGDRYTHVVHPRAGHISYVLSPGGWYRDGKRPLHPNPIDLLLEHAP